MKKLMKIVMALMMAFVLAACGNAQNAENTEPAEQGASSGEKLIVGLEAGFPPYEYIGDGGEVVGIDIDISKKIAEKLGKELEVKDMDFDGALLAVQSGKVDMVASGVSVTEEREKQMDFSERYVDSTEVVVVNAANLTVETPTWDALNDKIVAVQQGNIADIQVSNPENTQPKEVKRYTKFVQATEDLKNGKVDCIVMDQLPAEELVAANNDTLKILEGEPLFVDQYAIAVQKGNQELLDQINTVIKELKESGELDKIMENHAQK
ncbi:transporter substrate-binding domain-containing protein [Gallicola sp. Sow4_E12]|uniref:ABC transporter substrate-binding protein n=1 Tax=Gallicola sp. Sow4_E12 TaxID=3438785 RepID=UPI003F910E91